MQGLDHDQDMGAVQETWEALIRSRFEGASLEKDTRALAIERELAALKAGLVLAQRLRNAAVSASCALPAELLSLIFLQLRNHWLPVRQGTPEGAWELTLGWMTVLQVCNLWRETAVNTPALWTLIPCSALCPSYIPVFLTRSRNLPLVLEFTTYAASLSEMSSWCWFNSAILSRAESIQYREDASPDDDSSSQWRLLFQHTTPLLKSLDIELSTELDDRIIDSEMFRPPPNRPHTLTRLRLIDCFLLPNSPLLSSSLTHLILELSEPSPQSAFPDLTLLPNLRELRLLDIFPTAQDETSEIELPSCFKLLQLECQMHTMITSCFNLVARLKLPPDSTARLEALYPPNDSSDIDTMKEALRGFFNDSQRPVSELRIFETVIDTLRGQRTQAEWTLYPPEMGEALAVDKMHGARHAFCVEPQTTAVLSCISLTHLKSVCLSDWSIETTGGVFDAVLLALQDATQLIRLSLQSPWNCERLLQGLGEVDESHTADPVHAPFALFPQLEEVIIHDQGTFPFDERDRHIMISCLATAFLDFLGRRARHGAPLRKLLVAESLKDWDAWSLIEQPTTVTFFQHAIEPSWDPSI